MNLFKALFGNYSEKEIKRILPLQTKVLALEEEYKALSDEALKAKTAEFKERLVMGETLDDILPEAFAACREAGDRVLGMRHFPVQILGGIILHQGRISEMKTGEGKTLVATLPAYLNALSGKGVHIVTVNDYLAKRDSEWMGKLYRFMGLSVGLIIHGMTNEDKKAAYDADITYCTNNELGFDYLRDNMVIYKEQKVQREHNFAIVDEVDSILVDEARTPLIISGQSDKSTDLYTAANRFARSLKMFKVKEMNDKESDENTNYDGDYVVDEKARTATLTPEGVKKAEEYFKIENLNDTENIAIAHHVNQAIRAYGIMKRDVDYVVKDVFPHILYVLEKRSYIKTSPVFDGLDSSFLFAYQDRLFLLSSDGSVIEIDDYIAIGSGKSQAIGSLLCTEGLDPVNRIIKAIKASAANDIYVDYPIVISDTLSCEFKVLYEKDLKGDSYEDKETSEISDDRQ